MPKDKIKYKISIDPEYAENGEELGIEEIAFTSNPAIKVKGMAFNSQQKRQSFADNLKYRIAAPALIPMEIYRNDKGDEYYVEFTQDEIEDIFVKLMADKPDKLFNLEHNQSDKVDAFLLEAWLVGKDTKADRSWSEFGIDVPEGTLMMVSQFTNKEQYHKLVENNQTGLSIEGFLGLKLNKHEKMEDKLMMPDGEHQIGEKIYVVKDGAVVEIKDVVKEEMAAEEPVVEAEVKEEEMAAEEPVADAKEEEMAAEEPVAEESAKEEEMAIDPVVDEAAILAIIQPKLDEIYQLIADLKAGMEVDVEEDAVEEVAMSKQESFRHAFSSFTKFYSEDK